MSTSQEIDVDSLDPITVKPPAERYVLLWLVAMFEAGGRRCTFRRSTPFPSLAELDASKDLLDVAPPPASVAFDDVLKKLKPMANLEPVVYKDVKEGDIELNINGRQAVAHLRFDECADDPWCEVSMECLNS